MRLAEMRQDKGFLTYLNSINSCGPPNQIVVGIRGSTSSPYFYYNYSRYYSYSYYHKRQASSRPDEISRTSRLPSCDQQVCLYIYIIHIYIYLHISFSLSLSFSLNAAAAAAAAGNARAPLESRTLANTVLSFALSPSWHAYLYV